MTRYKLTLEYDGGGFVGWQRQDNGPSIQAALEDAILAFCGEQTVTAAAGRTDAGVHALGQVVHADILKPTTAETVRGALNFHLRPHAIVVLEAEAAAPDFHARFSATSRAYLYRIANRRAWLALERGRAWWVAHALDEQAMAEAARRLVGTHDFTSFRSTQCQSASPVKTLDVLEVTRAGEEIRIVARARSFLHHQVRNFAGTLKLVGEGKWTPDDVERALKRRERSAAGPTAPPEGLYLTAVGYACHQP